nr:MAG TPA: hypothetical protein [Caudoviricetes sp.]
MTTSKLMQNVIDTGRLKKLNVVHYMKPQKNRQEWYLKARRRQAKKSISTFSLPLSGYFVKENGGNYDEKCFK